MESRFIHVKGLVPLKISMSNHVLTLMPVFSRLRTIFVYVFCPLEVGGGGVGHIDFNEEQWPQNGKPVKAVLMYISRGTIGPTSKQQYIYYEMHVPYS